ncbi:MAG: transposase, partial [Rhodanobacteraceae bacterium]
ASEKLRLAKVLRVAPSLDVRANVKLPDTETLKAVLAHRFHVMRDYFRGVTAPMLRATLRAEKASADTATLALPRKLRRAMANGGRWLDEASRAKLQRALRERPQLAVVCDFRSRLAGLLERNGRKPEALLESLKQWCHEAEATGIQTLQDFAARLKGYQLAGERG